MMKKRNGLALLMCLALFATMALGSGSSDSGADKEIASVSSGGAESTSEEAASDTSTEETEAVETEEPAPETSEETIEEQVLFDQNDIKITATGFKDTLFGTDLSLLIENNSAQSVTVQARNASINGYMVDTMFSADVAAGKKANDGLTFLTSGLKECGIEQIATIEFNFNIFESESWEDVADSDVITVNTSIADSYTQVYDDSGDVLVDANGIKIVGKGLSARDSFWGPGVILCIENNTDQDITIQVRDVSVNGFMVQSSMSQDITVGKRAISDVQFFSSDLEDNGITDITDVELYFHVFNMNSWEDIYNSDVISIQFQ